MNVDAVFLPGKRHLFNFGKKLKKLSNGVEKMGVKMYSLK